MFGLVNYFFFSIWFEKKVFLAAQLPPIGSKSYYVERDSKHRRRHSFKSKLQRLVAGEDHIITTDVITDYYNSIGIILIIFIIDMNRKWRWELMGRLDCWVRWRSTAKNISSNKSSFGIRDTTAITNRLTGDHRAPTSSDRTELTPFQWGGPWPPLSSPQSTPVYI